MKQPLHILLIEHPDSSLKPSLEPLKKEGYVLKVDKVSNKLGLKNALETSKYDVLVSDFQLKGFDSLEALKVFKKTGLQIPFIAVSEVVGARTAVVVMKAGAQDFLLKDNIQMLPIIIKRELVEFKHRIELAKTSLELEKTKALFEVMFESFPDPILLHNYDKITNVNQAFLKEFGYSKKSDVLGLPPTRTIVFSEDIGIVRQQRLLARHTKTTFIPKIRLLRADKSIFLSEAYVSMLELNDEVQLQITIRNITKRIEAEEQIIKKQLDLEHAQKLAHIGSWEFSIADEGMLWSKENYRIFELEEMLPQALYKAFKKRTNPPHLAFLLHAFEKSKETGINFSFEYPIIFENRGVKHLLCKGEPVKNEQGNIIGLKGTCQDITKRKEMQERLMLQEQNSLLMLHAEQLPGIIYQFQMFPDGSSCFPFISGGGLELHEITAEEVLKDSSIMFRYIHEDDLDAFMQSIEISQSSMQNWFMDYRVVLPIKGIRWLRGNSKPVRLPDNSIMWHGYITDITADKIAEEKIKQSLLEKEVLLKEIHHRVKNNMQVITSLLSLQSSFTGDEAIQEIFRSSQYRINSMGMVHEMLYQSEDISKIDYGVYLGRLVLGLIKAMKGEENKIQLSLEAPNVSLNVDTAIPLGLIVNEVVTNALKYGFKEQTEGNIYIHLSSQEYPHFRLAIGDDGCGFSKTLDFKNSNSLGLMLISKLAVQLKGKMERLVGQKGTHYVLNFQEIDQF